jgi:hypothetical protein
LDPTDFFTQISLGYNGLFFFEADFFGIQRIVFFDADFFGIQRIVFYADFFWIQRIVMTQISFGSNGSFRRPPQVKTMPTIHSSLRRQQVWESIYIKGKKERVPRTVKGSKVSFSKLKIRQITRELRPTP